MQSMMPTSRSSWMSHILGLERLFSLRGPLTIKNSSILDRALLESFRPIMILGAFFTRRPSLLSKLEWITTSHPQDSNVRPDLFQTSTATPDLSFLMGFLAELPVLFLERDKCLRLVEAMQSPNAYESRVWAKVVLLRQTLQAWKNIWDNDHQSDVYETFPITKVESTQRVPWITAFSFIDIKIANVFVMYHVVVIFLTGLQLSLFKISLRHPSSVFATFDSSSFRQNQSIADIENAAVSICRSIEYHLQFLQSSRNPRDFHLFFPVLVARRTFHQMGRFSELTWLADAFEMMLSRTTMGIWADMDISDDFIGFHGGPFD